MELVARARYSHIEQDRARFDNELSISSNQQHIGGMPWELARGTHGEHRTARTPDLPEHSGEGAQSKTVG